MDIEFLGSVIWMGFQKVIDNLGERLIWHFGNGQDCLLGCDRILRVDHETRMDVHLKKKLSQQGLFYLVHKIINWQQGYPTWWTAASLGLIGVDANSWKNYAKILQGVGLCYN